MKDKLKNGETLEFTNERDDLILVWFNSKWSTFCLELNAKVIKATKTFKPVEDKLNFLLEL
jgi:hypothetical protein